MNNCMYRVYHYTTNRKGDDISYYDNVIINVNGLFQRYFVFNNMTNIKHVQNTYNY